MPKLLLANRTRGAAYDAHRDSNGCASLYGNVLGASIDSHAGSYGHVTDCCHRNSCGNGYVDYRTDGHAHHGDLYIHGG